MYIMITSKCNMHCAHCCYACTSRGKHMSVPIFRRACELARDWGDNIFLGGGEPTLHPQFETIFGIAMLHSTDDDLPPGIITNGSNEALTIKLLNLAKSGHFWCNVSIDKWHDPISSKVKDFALKYKMVRNVNGHIIKAGRSKIGSDDCPCDDLFIESNGDMWACACKITKLGNAMDKNLDIPYKYRQHMCEKDVRNEDPD